MTDGKVDRFAAEQDGYRASLKPRQVQMIAIGGAIGSGLFLGAGGQLASAGPALVFVYALCGLFAFFILRALGELVLHRPSSGSFVSYAREFLGEKYAFAAGWMYFLTWATGSIVDVTAIALYLHYWSAFTVVPQWALALVALVVVLGVNLLAVKVFGELEFWFALVKVSALVIFLVIGVIFLSAGWPVTVDGDQISTGLTMIATHGGLLPNGILPLVVVGQGVIFAYAAIEMVGTASGEMADPQKQIPRAINTVIIRIAVFYVGSIALLALLLPSTAYSASESPFVTFFSSIGSPEAGAIAGSLMNFVVLTAALSSLNAGLYSTGRILKSMSFNGAAPRFVGRMSRSGVPYGGILLTATFTLVGVGLNAIVPQQAFEIVLNIAALGVIAAWATILLAHWALYRRWKAGLLERTQFRLWGAPVTNIITLAFLAAVLVLIVFDYPVGTYTIGLLIVVVPAIVVGWYLTRRRIRALP
ncbi:amino acid permease [Herbiconiux daphne]|uniref:Amino acid permease n=1 Tax=Herbiconiux daphne TaxID=2970914 RepID=A0ABT2H7D7_9MICO|nr:amino acid permease [Herbiconiux daphne]MCS5735807.1 amino acid permease [Herbiconiux daphne]